MKYLKEERYYQPKGVLTGLNKLVAEFALLTTACIPSDFPYDNILLDLSFLSDNQMADAFASTELNQIRIMLKHHTLTSLPQDFVRNSRNLQNFRIVLILMR